MRWVLRLMAVAAIGLAVLVPGVAWAQEGDYPPSTTSTTSECTVIDGAVVCGTVVTVPIEVKGTATLPFTGGNAALLTGLGLVAVGAGVGLVLVGKRSASAS
jgi:hypothetical protein